MKVSRTNLMGAVLIEPDTFFDERGSFLEIYQTDRYADVGVPGPFLQDNRSISRRGVVRGLHYQIARPQGHLITITHGSVFDVGVDLRRHSSTFGHVITTILAADPPRQIYLPPGIAHGFCVLSDTAEIWYKCTDVYHSESEGGLLWSDPDLGILWPVNNPIISSRDSTYPRLRDIPRARLPSIAS